jgi:hypothetical protein
LSRRLVMNASDAADREISHDGRGTLGIVVASAACKRHGGAHDQSRNNAPNHVMPSLSASSGHSNQGIEHKTSK